MVKFFVTLFESQHTNSTTCPDPSGFSFRSSNPKSYANPRFIPLPFGFSTHNPDLKTKTRVSISPNPFAPLHSVTTLAFPNPISGMSSAVFSPENQRPQNFPATL